MPYNWTFDETRQELHSPAGYTVSIREIAQLLADRRDCKHDFHGDWSGWKMRRQFLIPPFSGRNGPKLTPSNARQFLEWIHEPARLDAQRRLQHAAESRPLLYLVR
jgi:hypothetical protein